MKFFIDTANLNEIREAMSYGVISGATTNPKILSAEGNISPKERALEIINIVKGPVSVEVLATDRDGMVREAEEFSKWHTDIVVKIPIGIEGLKATKILSKKGIKTNVTACMCMSQALLAAMNGATYVSLFYGRISDLGFDPAVVIKDTSDILKKNNLKAEIIIGSIRSVLDINRSITAGADIITVPFKFLKQLVVNPQTDATIKEFLDSWKAVSK